LSSQVGKSDRVEENESGIGIIQDYHRHDLSDEARGHLEKKLPGRRVQSGRIAQNNRRFINGAENLQNFLGVFLQFQIGVGSVFWILRTGAPWRDLPPDYGGGKTPTDVFVVGEIRVSGKSCRKRCLKYPN